MSWLWSQSPSEDETKQADSDPYATPTFEASLDDKPSATTDDSFGSAFTADVDLSPPQHSTTSATQDPFATSRSLSSQPSPDYTLPYGTDSLSSSPDGQDQQAAPSINFSTLGRIDPTVISTPGIFSDSRSVDYVFADDYKEMRKKSTTEQLTYLTGGSYLLGSIAGASIGLAHAIPESAGKPARLRLNAILNGVAKRGTAVGNACGVLVLGFCVSESIIYNYTNDETITNYAAAGALSGALYKSTRGMRAAATWGVGGACLALATVYASRRGYYGRGLQGAL